MRALCQLRRCARSRPVFMPLQRLIEQQGNRSAAIKGLSLNRALAAKSSQSEAGAALPSIGRKAVRKRAGKSRVAPNFSVAAAAADATAARRSRKRQRSTGGAQGSPHGGSASVPRSSAHVQRVPKPGPPGMSPMERMQNLLREQLAKQANARVAIQHAPCAHPQPQLPSPDELVRLLQASGLLTLR